MRRNLTDWVFRSMGKTPSSNRTALTVSLAVVGVLIVAVLIAVLRPKPPEPVAAPEPTKVAAPAPTPVPTEIPLPTPMATPETQEVVEIIVTPEGMLPTDPTPESTMDPELQPRKTHLLDFRDLTSVPEGFKLDGVILTDKGFQLPPPAPGEEDLPRFGSIESPVYALDFPSNAVSPLWLEDLPEGTNIFIELAVTPDAENWGIWHPIEPDDDVAEITDTFPDGRPNPNAGHKAGGVLFWGFRQYQQYKFKVTLSSEVKESPTLGTFHLFYQDSTLGQGHIAELQEDEIQK